MAEQCSCRRIDVADFADIGGEGQPVHFNIPLNH